MNTVFNHIARDTMLMAMHHMREYVQQLVGVNVPIFLGGTVFLVASVLLLRVLVMTSPMRHACRCFETIICMALYAAVCSLVIFAFLLRSQLMA